MLASLFLSCVLFNWPSQLHKGSDSDKGSQWPSPDPHSETSAMFIISSTHACIVDGIVACLFCLCNEFTDFLP